MIFVKHSDIVRYF